MSLGCGETHVVIQGRGGTPRLGEVPYENLFYTRALDEMSTCSVSVPSGAFADEACCQMLADLDAWEHEVAVWRDDELVWVGPVVDARFSDEGADIEARDLFVWFERRNVKEDLSFVAVDLATIFQGFADHAISQDDFGLTVHAQPTGVLGERVVRVSQLRRVADVLRELSRSGLDFTVTGRTMRVGDVEVGGELAVLSTEATTRVVMSIDGMAAATEAVIRGNQLTAISSISSTVGGVDPRVGLLTRTDLEFNVRDRGSAEQAAQSRLDLLNPAPQLVEVELAPQAPYSFNDLVPGRRLDARLQAGCRRIVADMRLHRFDISVSVGEGTTEAPVAFLQPLGTVT